MRPPPRPHYRRAIALSAACSALLSLTPSLQAAIVLSPGVVYTPDSYGEYPASNFSFQGGTLVLNGTGGNLTTTLLLDTPTLTGSGLIEIAGWGTNGAIIKPSPSLPSVTVGPDISIALNGPVSNISYGGTIGSPAKGLSLLGPVLASAGSLTITGSNWTASSLAVSDSGNLTLDGTFTSSAVLPNVHRSGNGIVTIQGAVNNAGSSIDLAPLAGTAFLRVTGSIAGGALTSSAGPARVSFGQFAKLDAVTVDSDLVADRYLNFQGDLTLANNHTISFSFAPDISGAGAITGSGTIHLTGPSGSTGGITASAIGPGITLRTSPNPSGNVRSTTINVPTLAGTISVETFRTSVLLAADNWVNTGTLLVSDGTLQLGATFQPSTVGTLLRSGNGVVEVVGTLNMPPGDDTLHLNASTGPWNFASATVNGGTIRTSGAAVAQVVYNSTFNGVTLDGQIRLTSTATLNTGATGLTLLDGSVLNVTAAGALRGPLVGTSLISFNGGAAFPSGPTALVAPAAANYTYAPTISFSSTDGAGSIGTTGQSVTVQGNVAVHSPSATILLAASNFTNAGTITATSGGVIGLNPPTFVNQGTLDVADGAIQLIGTYTPASYRAMNLPPTPLFIGGTLNNANDSMTSTPESPLTVVNSASVTGGALTGSSAAPVVIGPSATLNNVTLAGSIAFLWHLNSASKFTFANGSSLALRSGEERTGLNMSQATLAGTLDVSFDGTGPGTVTAGPTLPSSLSIRTGTEGGNVTSTSSLSITLNGTISAQTAGKSISLSALGLRNNGTIQAINGGTLAASGAFTNAGLVTLGTSSSLKVTGTLTNTGRLNFAGGSLILNYATPSPAVFNAVRAQLFAGRNGGTWDGSTGFISSTAAADPSHLTAVGYAESAPLLQLTGTKTATWAGQSVDATALLLTLTLYGDANLDGRITLDDYALLDAGYARNPAVPLWTNGDFNYDGAIDSQDYFLIDRTFLTQSQSPSTAFLAQRQSQFGTNYVSELLTSVPEPSLALSSILHPLSSLLLRRRRP